MAAPPLRRAAWIGAAALAAAALTALALSGGRPEPGLVRFEAGGVMRDIAPAGVTEVVVSAGGRQWRFERGGARWAVGGAAVEEPVAARLDTGLRFLHVSAPQRVPEPGEVAGTPAAEFGLDPPRYAVAVRAGTGAPFTIEFGARNHQGLAQFARVGGAREIVLLPGFVGEAWEAVMAGP